MVRIYVVDNGGQWTHREWRVLKYLGVETQIVPHDTPPEKLIEAKVDGLVLSGGAPRVGLSDQLGRCGDYLDTLAVPVVGICAGHQYMARHFGGQAAPGGSEFGGARLVLNDAKSPLFEDVPHESTVWENHHDEVSIVPKDFDVLGSSQLCKVQAMQHKRRPLFGLQFHPEVENTEHGGTIFRNFVKICETHKK